MLGGREMGGQLAGRYLLSMSPRSTGFWLGGTFWR